MSNLTDWQFFLLVTAILLLFAEIGFRVGRIVRDDRRAPSKEQLGPVQAALLTLLGLLIGFTFSMAVTRHDARRTLVVREASAIQTAWLRASLLPDGHQQPVRDALQRYVDLRLALQRGGSEREEVAKGLRLSKDTHDLLWQHASDAVKAAPGVPTGQFAAAVNEVIEVHIARIAAARARIPNGVWLLLMLIAACGSIVTGYRAGMDAKRTLIASLFLPVLVTSVILLVYDLSNPLNGLIGVSQQPLVDLQQTLAR